MIQKNTKPYTSINPVKIIETVEKLSRRINERFPDSSLGKASNELVLIAKDSAEKQRWIKKPHFFVRVGVITLLAAIVSLIAVVISKIKFTDEIFSLSQFLQSSNALLGTGVYLGAAGFFLFSVEQRIKLKKALEALHELRAMAHIIDMHQLTKDPEVFIFGIQSTTSSPNRSMSMYELCRYFDYCIEMLAVISKISAIYIQDFHSPQAIEAVEQIEDLTTALSAAIYQKITVLNRTVSNVEENKKT